MSEGNQRCLATAKPACRHFKKKVSACQNARLPVRHKAFVTRCGVWLCRVPVPLLVFLAGVLLLVPNAHGDLEADAAALLQFKDSLTVKGITDLWNTSVSACEWPGITCWSS